MHTKTCQLLREIVLCILNIPGKVQKMSLSKTLDFLNYESVRTLFYVYPFYGNESRDVQPNLPVSCISLQPSKIGNANLNANLSVPSGSALIKLKRFDNV